MCNSMIEAFKDKPEPDAQLIVSIAAEKKALLEMKESEKDPPSTS